MERKKKHFLHQGCISKYLRQCSKSLNHHNVQTESWRFFSLLSLLDNHLDEVLKFLSFFLSLKEQSYQELSFYRGIMTRRLSSSTRSHTEDSIFLRPDEDPVWLDEPTKVEKIGDGAAKKDGVSDCKDGGQSQEGEEVFIHKVYALFVELQCWAALFISSQVTVCISNNIYFS